MPNQLIQGSWSIPQDPWILDISFSVKTRIESMSDDKASVWLGQSGGVLVILSLIIGRWKIFVALVPDEDSCDGKGLGRFRIRQVSLQAKIYRLLNLQILRQLEFFLLIRLRVIVIQDFLSVFLVPFFWCLEKSERSTLFRRLYILQTVDILLHPRLLQNRAPKGQLWQLFNLFLAFFVGPGIGSRLCDPSDNGLEFRLLIVGSSRAVCWDDAVRG